MFSTCWLQIARSISSRQYWSIVSRAAPASASCRRSRMPCLRSQSSGLGCLGRNGVAGGKARRRIVGTVQLGLVTPPNQPHRADIKKLLVPRYARAHGVEAALMARVEDEARRKRLSPLYASGLDPNRHHPGLCDVSGWPAVRYRAVLEAAGPVITVFTR